MIMAVSEKAKEKLDEAGKEIKEAVDSLKHEVTDLSKKVKDKLRGTGEEMRGSAEELTLEVKKLSKKVKDLIPGKRRKGSLPVRFVNSQGMRPDSWEKPFLELRSATDRLFDDFARTFGLPMAEIRSPWGLTSESIKTDWPPIDMDETDKEIRITAELPGVDRDNIDVSVTNKDPG
jgi:hypothetical protein